MSVDELSSHVVDSPYQPLAFVCPLRPSVFPLVLSRRFLSDFGVIRFTALEERVIRNFLKKEMDLSVHKLKIPKKYV